MDEADIAGSTTTDSRPSLGLAAIVVVTVLYYGGVFRQWFAADDFWFLYRAKNTSWPLWTSRAWDWQTLDAVPQFHYFRPIYLMTFRAEYSLFGLHAGPYHAVNLALHVACVAMLWHIALRVTRSAPAAHAAALLFACHPANASAVAWVVNGNTPLAEAFGLLAFLLFMRYCEAQRYRAWWYVGAIAAFACAVLTHSSIVSIAAAVPLWYFLISQEPAAVFRPAAWRPFVIPGALMAPYLLIQKSVHDNTLDQAITFRLGSHIFSNYADYFGMSFYPADHPPAWINALAMTLLALSAGIAIAGRSRILTFALAWYVVSIFPSSTYTLGAAGRLLYPAAPAFALVVAGTVVALADLRRLRGTFKGGAAMGLAVSALMLCWTGYFANQPSQWPPGNYNSRQSEIAERFLAQLRSEHATIEVGGTIYVAHAPTALTQFGDDALRNLVQIYYPGVDARSLPMRSAPYWTEADARAHLSGNDALIVYRGPVQ